MSHIDHIGLFSPTSLLEPEVQFFNAALKPLGMGEQFRVHPTVVALGTKESPFLWISNLDGDRNEIKEKDNVQGTHIAFKAKSACSISFPRDLGKLRPGWQLEKRSTSSMPPRSKLEARIMDPQVSEKSTTPITTAPLSSARPVIMLRR